MSRCVGWRAVRCEPRLTHTRTIVFAAQGAAARAGDARGRPWWCASGRLRAGERRAHAGRCDQPQAQVPAEPPEEGVCR